MRIADTNTVLSATPCEERPRRLIERKDHHNLAIELFQQMIASYEVGRRRVPISVLPAIAHALAVSVGALIGERRDRPRSCCSK